VNSRYLSVFLENIRGNFEDEIQHETPYKIEGAKHTQPELASLVAGQIGWSEFFKSSRKFMDHELGWRAVGALEQLASEHPETLRNAIGALLETKDAASYYDRLARAGVDIRDDAYKAIRGKGSRAAVASTFLFIEEPTEYPVYRARNVGKPLSKIVRDNINAGSPEEILERYYGSLDELSDVLRKEGIPVRHRLDLQGLLFVCHYKKWFEGIES
jgi:hypothetical protein